MKQGNRLTRYYSDYYQAWLNRRTPVVEQMKLTHRQLYIFPSMAGLFFLLLIALLWLMATNYENNLVFILCFLLVSLFVVVIHLSHANLSGVTIRPVRANSVFAGEQAAVQLCLSQPSNKLRDNIELQFKGGEPVEITLDSKGDTFITLLVPTKHRGYLKPGRLYLRTFYPLSLLRVWSYVHFSFDAVVYPSPQATDNPSKGLDANNAGHYTGTEGADDYAGLKQYQPGEPLRHLAWKKYAQDKGMWIKQYADPVSERLWIEWGAFIGMHREQRLSCMAWLVCHYCERDVEYGLSLPGISVPPDSGLLHRNRLLRELAIFELDVDLQSKSKRDPEV